MGRRVAAGESIATGTELAVPASIRLVVSQFLKNFLLAVFEEASLGNRDEKRARNAVASSLKTTMPWRVA
jgi:hypothetical protein